MRVVLLGLMVCMLLQAGCRSSVYGATNLSSVSIRSIDEAHRKLGEPRSLRLLEGGCKEFTYQTHRFLGGNNHVKAFGLPLVSIARTTTSREWLVLTFDAQGDLLTRHYGSTNQRLSWCPWPGH